MSCRNCTKTYSHKTGHSTLANHLNSEHKIVESSEDEDEETRTTIKSPKNRRNHREITVNRRKQINFLLTKFIIDNMQPFSILNCKSFLE